MNLKNVYNTFSEFETKNSKNCEYTNLFRLNDKIDLITGFRNNRMDTKLFPSITGKEVRL